MYRLFAIFIFLSFSVLASEARASTPKFTFSNSIPDQPEESVPSRVTYDIAGHHLGDHLMAYVRGKWLSYNYNIPLMYRPFPYANQFKLYEEERKKFRTSQASDFDKIHEVKNEWEVCFEDISKTLYVVPNFTELETEYQLQNQIPAIEIDWGDKEFRKTIRKLLKPVHSIGKSKVPRGRISVAVYIPFYYEAEGQEKPSDDHHMQYPPLRYYIEQIRKINKMFYSRPLYIHIFCDGRPSVEWVKRIQQEVQGHNLVFGCREKPGKTAKVEDFIQMCQYDCLIRPAGNLGFLAEQVGDYLIAIKPIHYVQRDNIIEIDEVVIKVRGD
jgi:hypothetical protein